MVVFDAGGPSTKVLGYFLLSLRDEIFGYCSCLHLHNLIFCVKSADKMRTDKNVCPTGMIMRKKGEIMELKDSALFKKWGIFSKGMDAQSMQLSFASHLEYSLSKDKYTATMRDLYHSLALATRDRVIERWIHTQQRYYDNDAKRIYYLSAEYLMGRALVNYLINLGIYDQTVKAMEDLKIDFPTLVEEEPDAGLGNGGLGRLAACFLDSMASLELPAYGYGLRYEFGIFEQHIRNCMQAELPDAWLKFGNPWEIPRPEYSFTVRFYGSTKDVHYPDGRMVVEWVNAQEVIGIGYDYPIDGYGNDTVNTLRLWSARASREFNLEYFQHGDYLKAVEEKNLSENISKVLYPNDAIIQGQELRLKQQYFFVSCSVQDIIRRYRVHHQDFDAFPDKVAIQLNDTHPSLTVAELMRVLIDDYGLGWEKAWDVTVRTCAYTNHTLMAEALERWPVAMFGRLLPRHLQIIHEINRRFLTDVSLRYVGDNDRMRRMSIIEEGPEKKVRMAHLAIVGSHSVNGVAELHTRLLREKELKDFDEFFPGKFNNKTNGITPRRWLLAANLPLASLISEHIGEGWIRDLSQLRQLEPLADSKDFRDRARAIKRANKIKLSAVAQAEAGMLLDPDSLFDVQVKRIHEYKRQILNILNVVRSWLQIKDGGYTPNSRTYIFGGKAAPSYAMAKMSIRLICQVADMINRDPNTNDRIRVVFLPNYRVSLAEKIFPASNISEQISTAGYEASGTGNMKFMLNGALTLGTLDGANIEILEEVGPENIFIFGLTADEVRALKPNYRPRDYYEKDPMLKRVIDLISSGFFNPQEPHMFQPLLDNLLNHDPFLVLADFASYAAAQDKIDLAYSDRDLWAKKAILNIARSGKFSSDRTILEYNRDIWHAAPVSVTRKKEGK
jgi:glycogen phosphorylase